MVVAVDPAAGFGHGVLKGGILADAEGVDQAGGGSGRSGVGSGALQIINANPLMTVPCALLEIHSLTWKTMERFQKWIQLLLKL